MYPATAKPIRVAAGPHTVTCSQKMNNKSWTQQVVVGSGETTVVRGALLGTFDVSIATDVVIGGVSYKGGTVAKLGGRVLLEKDGVKIYVTISGACAIRDQPDLNCYR